MNSQEFLKEVLNSEICPSNFEIIYKSFLKYQKAAIDTLNEFHRVCEENKIQYQLAYGSLLGAIRDNGQIPWDYDVDVFVPFEEKDRLITSLKRDLDDKYYFYCPEVDSKCRHFVMRLAPKKYRTPEKPKLIGSFSSICEAEAVFVVVAHGVTVGIGLAVFVLHVLRHILILVETRNIVGADADAIFIHSDDRVVLRESEGKFSCWSELTEEDVKSSLREGIEAGCQNIGIRLHISHEPS